MKRKIDYKKILKFVLVFVGIITVLLLITNQPVFADVGNNNSYDTSGDYSSSGDGDGFWLIVLLFDLFGPFGALIILLIVGAVFMYLKKRKMDLLIKKKD